MRKIRESNFKVKIYKRLGAMVGGIIGVLAMIVAVCMEKTILGASLLIICICVGIIIGSLIQKTHKDR